MSANRFLERMLTVDPTYGSQEHQRDYVRRYEERQALAPCPEDHEHADSCYAVRGKRDGFFTSMGIR